MMVKATTIVLGLLLHLSRMQGTETSRVANPVPLDVLPTTCMAVLFVLVERPTVNSAAIFAPR
jgi:hypothetical protein